MPKIFEIFGYALTDLSSDAVKARLTPTCPFMGKPCDGGGNRYASQLDLNKVPELKAIFPEHKTLPAGVCSIRTTESEDPWVVCPRRLLSLGKSDSETREHQRGAERVAISYLGYPAGTKLGVWSEISIEYSQTKEGVKKSFDYAFDYVLWPVGDVDIEVIHKNSGNKKPDTTKKQLIKEGYKLEENGVICIVKDAPLSDKSPSIIEIMTSSTSGGNKNKRTTIPNCNLF